MSSRPSTARVAGAVSDGAWIRSRQASATPELSRLSRLLAEARWIAGATLAAALLVVLLTYSREDPSFTHAVGAAHIQNLGGRLGAWVADVVLLVFGLSAYLVALGLAADPAIRAGDEVMVVDEHDQLLATGSSVLSGGEMLRFNYGVAVKVRQGR